MLQCAQLFIPHSFPFPHQVGNVSLILDRDNGPLNASSPDDLRAAILDPEKMQCMWGVDNAFRNDSIMQYTIVFIDIGMVYKENYEEFARLRIHRVGDSKKLRLVVRFAGRLISLHSCNY